MNGIPNSKPERIETVRINMKLDKAAYDRYTAEVKLICPNLWVEMLKDDSLNVKYEFFITYLGQVAANLAAVKTICLDPDVVIDANCEMLTEGRILAYEVLRELDNIIRIVKERNGAPSPPKRTWRQWWRGE